ncbi:protein-disulfide reductase DsbD domain-containing protein [Agaribacterium haliotis]|uniref:protein-disulfide reductase DsbD domain-containing protein n=1 Tax=Agaribacterium haliotis TaxID=2013869 RepID=UPI0013042A2E|nr:protein-disulfide reductase DsbD domain-containing protein [Agaribacterium haliotis]
MPNATNADQQITSAFKLSTAGDVLLWHIILLALLFASPLLINQAAAQAATDNKSKAQQPHIQVQLIAENISAHKSRVGILFEPEPGWHIYWLNPGDTGLAPNISWRGSEGLKFGPLKWPMPEHIPVAHLVNYGYHGTSLLWSELSRSAGTGDNNSKHNNNSPGIVQAELSWLVCKESCVPGQASLSLDLNQLDQASSAQAGKYFAKAQAKLPKALATMQAHYWTDSDKLYIDVYFKQALFSNAARNAHTKSDIELFIKELDLVNYSASADVHAEHNVLRWSTTLNDYYQSAPDRIHAVLVLDQQQAFEFAINLKTEFNN